MNLAGPQVYIGPESSPSFMPGTFTLDGVYTLTIRAAPVPEPASLTLMLGGRAWWASSLRAVAPSLWALRGGQATLHTFNMFVPPG